MIRTPEAASFIALQYAVRLGNQGNMQEAHAMTQVALAAAQSTNLEHLQNKFKNALMDAIIDVLVPFFERAESGHQKVETATQANFLNLVMGTDDGFWELHGAPKTLARMKYIRQTKTGSNDGKHAAINAI